MRTHAIFLIGISFFIAFAGLSCDRDSPTIVDRPPLIKSFFPEARHLGTLVGDTLRFSVFAEDPDHHHLGFLYMMGDSIVSTGSEWTYVVHDTGLVQVQARVSDGNQHITISWTLSRAFPVNHPPQIIHYEPEDLNPYVTIGKSIDFSITANDPEGQPVSYAYYVDGKLSGANRQFSYETTHLGQVDITGTAYDGEQLARISWNLTVTDYPDSIRPAPVMITSVKTGLNVGEIIVEWIAVGDDSLEGLASTYKIRTASTPIINEFNWERASDRPGEPPPAPPGETMTAVVPGLIPANFVYVAVRALDEFGNLSALGNTIGTEVKGMDISGMVSNVLTGEPIENISVLLLGSSDRTESDGRFYITDLPKAGGWIYFRDEIDAGDIGSYFDLDLPYIVQHGDWLDIFLFPNVDLITSEYPNFLSYFKQITDKEYDPFGNTLRHWELPIAFYVPPHVHNGIDYQQVVKDVLQEWEDSTGLNLFEVTNLVPEVGVVIEYDLTQGDREEYEVLLWSPEFYPLKARIRLKSTYDPSIMVALQKVVRHEVGHSLGLKHSRDPWHIMVGGRVPLATYPSQDEIWAVRTIYRLPRTINMDFYQYN